VGAAGAVAAAGQEAWPAADVDASATDRRHTVTDHAATVLVTTINEWL